MQNDWRTYRGKRSEMWRLARRELAAGNVVVVATTAGYRTLVPYGHNVIRICPAYPPPRQPPRAVRLGPRVSGPGD